MKKFNVRMSERCFRFKPDALPSHAPQKPGVYEFVTFKDGTPEVLFVGVALGGPTVFSMLSDHLMGKAEPTAAQLFGAAQDVYFDYVADADIQSLEDLKEIAAAFVRKHNPKFNAGKPAYAAGEAEIVELE